MKKSLLLLTFACFLFAGNQLSFAQKAVSKDNTTIKNTNDAAKNDALKVINLLKRETKVSSDQKNEIYEVFVVVNKKKSAIENITDAAEQKAKLTKLHEFTNEQLQKVLTSEQFALYTKKMTAH
ncbi:hypothetical protein [Psychroserpens sp. SPM9]|uniref:hypothetical protein n=1 Tax=Psychroserpens sp. SPM9 TaxID=2975598 RepID=UPI0021A63201|nr:hypothetical protein [Psychroserpens sp. SPM9]MDG5489958.1 hypothetical protein [Psychroserpens sp. SPM9]